MMGSPPPINQNIPIISNMQGFNLNCSINSYSLGNTHLGTIAANINNTITQNTGNNLPLSSLSYNSISAM